jgi:large subunit ribosomal protein L22
MSDETPKDVEPETPEAEEAPATEAAAEEAKPKRRSRAKKADAEATAEATADDGTEEESPKPRRSRAKKADEEAAPEPVAEDADDEDEIEPTEEDEEAADEAASEEELDEDEDEEEAEQPAPAARRRRGRGRRGAEADEEEAAPAARPTRAARAPGERVLVRAQAKYVRTSARKARLVCDHIRGKSVQEARAILAHTPRAVARDWSKLLESAVANAEHNHELLGDDLRIASVTADEGPTLKRFRPRAMGRATRIRKRTSHLTILLTPKE